MKYSPERREAILRKLLPPNNSLSPWCHPERAYSRPRLPLIPDEACHPVHAKAATDSTAKLPPRQAA
ncbi:hypothetical protein [Marinobacter sp.]|uniref:hypothetical protein n=1 Tax=Marinobacter sp. TaxID=50741 RepID=UPI001B455A0E|nr:hypothetical protein [Marinobacter sp.]MBQ0833992.1 hypothetical protein [Marinobacter sp.]